MYCVCCMYPSASCCIHVTAECLNPLPALIPALTEILWRALCAPQVARSRSRLSQREGEDGRQGLEMKTSVQSMDLAADLERIIQELEGGHGPDPYREVICEILGHIPNPPPPPPSPAGPGFNCHHQAVDIGDVSQQLLCGDSIMQADGGLYSQGQYLSYERPVHNVRGPAACCSPAQPYVPMTLPQGGEFNLPHVNGMPVYVLPPGISVTSFAPAAPSQKTFMSKKRKCNQKEDMRPYIKKPPNAFMMFLREQRQTVVTERNPPLNSAEVNAVVGQRWKALSNEEKNKYYEEADRESQLHAQLFPQWSSRANYGKKRKRIRTKSRYQCLSMRIET
ncbi:transcription factor 7-like 1 isoform X1 [Scophthalmus maximus]|uniref:transcription factor 7-like 1 isoform X1 n=1 Tax=Scophthalmus maximus TaxID=52904 RepID=UPI000F323836|nr:transcription factor 7-like 1 isoform X1 [Scophthalmus maximus]XP_047185700.1 transcription factor 7-like 1 isoform X1 [Scophthalmus maximus]